MTVLAKEEHKKNKKYPSWYKNKNTLKTFKKDDIVRCTLDKNLYKVYKIMEDGVLIAAVNLDSEFLKIAPNFLQKFKGNKKWLEILYEG